MKLNNLESLFWGMNCYIQFDGYLVRSMETWTDIFGLYIIYLKQWKCHFHCSRGMPYNLNIRILESVSLTPFEMYWEKQKRKGGGREKEVGRRRKEEKKTREQKEKENKWEEKKKADCRITTWELPKLKHGTLAKHMLLATPETFVKNVHKLTALKAFPNTVYSSRSNRNKQ